MSEQCKKTIYGDWGRHRGCSRNATKDGYCKQHHPDAVAARGKKRDDDYEKKRKDSPYYRLGVALKRITELEAKLEAMTNCYKQEVIAKTLQDKAMVKLEAKLDQKFVPPGRAW
jgi:hypothetical protein